MRPQLILVLAKGALLSNQKNLRRGASYKFLHPSSTKNLDQTGAGLDSSVGENWKNSHRGSPALKDHGKYRQRGRQKGRATELGHGFAAEVCSGAEE